jgi:hypothetical protein
MRFRATPALQRGPALRGRVTIYAQRGQIRARSWPKKKKKPLSPKQQNWVDWFRVTRRMSKYAEPGQQALAKELTKGTGLYPGDLLMMAARGNLYPRLVDGDDEYTTFQPKLEPVMFQGARAPLAANQVIAAGVFTKLIWGLPTFQTTAFWAAGQPTRFTIPTGVTKVNVSSAVWGPFPGLFDYFMLIRINGAAAQVIRSGRAINNFGEECETGPLNVVATDYLEVEVSAGLGGTIQKIAATWFGLEVLEAA